MASLENDIRDRHGLGGTRGLRRAMSAHEAPLVMQIDEPESGPPKVYGHFIVWDEWAEIDSMLEGHFLERYAQGCADKTIRENRSRMRCLFQHGEDPNVGKKVIGPIAVLEPDEIGVYYEVPMLTNPDGSLPNYLAELLPGIREGLYGSSCLMDVIKWSRNPGPKVSEYNPKGLEERTLTEVRVLEFGPCVFQWYEGATASARAVSTTDEEIMRRLAQDPQRFLDAAERAGITLQRAQSDFGQTAAGTTKIANTQFSVSSTAYVPVTHVNEEEPANTRRYQRAVERFGDTLWAVTPQHFGILMAIIEERISGYRPSQDEVSERISDGRPSPDGTPKGTTALIPIGGTIMPHASSFSNVSQSGTSIEGLQEQFRTAIADDNVSAIVLNIDSPGGAADLVPEMGAEIAAARGKKPIYAMANTMAASAAYWLASQADEVIISPSGQVGSIGVYTAHKDISAQEADQGVKTTLVSAGRYKTEGNPYEPLTDAAKKTMQSRVNLIHGMFLEAVAGGRGTTAKDVQENYGEGRMFFGQEAVDAGLADRVMTLDELLVELDLPTDDVAGSIADEEPVLSARVSVAATTPAEPEPTRATTQERVKISPPAWIYGEPRVEEGWNLTP